MEWYACLSVLACIHSDKNRETEKPELKWREGGGGRADDKQAEKSASTT